MKNIELNAPKEGTIRLDNGKPVIERRGRMTAHSVDAAWTIVYDILAHGTQAESDELLSRIRDCVGSAELCNGVIDAFEDIPEDHEYLMSIAAECAEKMAEFGQHVSDPVVEEMAEVIAAAKRLLPCIEDLSIDESVDYDIVMGWTMPVEESDDCEHGSAN